MREGEGARRFSHMFCLFGHLVKICEDRLRSAFEMLRDECADSVQRKQSRVLHHVSSSRRRRLLGQDTCLGWRLRALRDNATGGLSSHAGILATMVAQLSSHVAFNLKATIGFREQPC